MKTAIVGLGAVGAAMLRAADANTCGIDINPTTVERCRSWSAGPVGTDHAMVEGCELVFLCVGTPPGEGGGQQVRQVTDALEVIRPYLDSDTDVVVRSTVVPSVLPVGGSYPVPILVNPEFLREHRRATDDLLAPPFIVAGTPCPGMAERIFEWYRLIGVRGDVPRVELRVADAMLLKFACNWWHAVKVEFANFMGDAATVWGADGPAVMNAFCQDHQLNISIAYLRPGRPFGGRCLPKDLAAGITALRDVIPVELLRAVQAANQRRLECPQRFLP